MSVHQLLHLLPVDKHANTNTEQTQTFKHDKVSQLYMSRVLVLAGSSEPSNKCLRDAMQTKRKAVLNLGLCLFFVYPIIFQPGVDPLKICQGGIAK